MCYLKYRSFKRMRKENLKEKFLNSLFLNKFKKKFFNKF